LFHGERRVSGQPLAGHPSVVVSARFRGHVLERCLR
jgi:hypothetical protein